MTRIRISLALSIACAFTYSSIALTSSYATIVPRASKPAQLLPDIEEKLGGSNRYLTSISTDKPIYKVGDKVYLRAVILRADNHKPLNQQSNVQVKIEGPKGDIVCDSWSGVQDSVWSSVWTVPSSQAGGVYKVHATYPNEGFTAAERSFEVRAFRAPRLNSHITFKRDGYGPGEKVTAVLDVKRAEGGFPVGATVTVNARVDSEAIPASTAKVDDKGLCTVTFNLPAKISRGEGTLALTIQDGGVVETASKTIPILLKTVDLQMFPEGGDLVAGFENRVYVQAFQPDGKPADIEGYIVSQPASAIRRDAIKFKTEHEGRGRFKFTPESGKKYFLKITKPTGVNKTYALPSVKSSGAVIQTEQEVFKRNEPINFKVATPASRFSVTIAKREKQVAVATFESRKSKHQKGFVPISLKIGADIDGVLIVPVWDANGKPLAERLVYREQAQPLTVKITPDHNSYAPGGAASVTIKATNAAGKPVSAIVGVTVTDDSVLQMVEKREQVPQLPVMVFLEPEVKDLADAQVYLNPTDPKGPLATDLLLGTQGWRRFALVDVKKFMLANGDNAKRVLAESEHALPTVVSYSVGALAGQKGMFKNMPGDNQYAGGAKRTLGRQPLRLPEEIGRVEGPRDMNMFQVEPTVVDERHYTSGRVERHQKTSPRFPEGSPLPDDEQAMARPLQRSARWDFPPNHWRHEQLRGRHAGLVPPPRPIGFVTVREYAHKIRENRKPNDRVDFAETLYWAAAAKTDPKTGEAVIHFGLNDSVTSFQIAADAFDQSGSIGAASTRVKSLQPFYTEAKLPLEVTSGDHVLLPINLINGSNGILQAPKFSIDQKESIQILPLLKQLLSLKQGERARILQPLDIAAGQGLRDIVLHANAGQYEDISTRQLMIKPKGYPIEKAFGGLIGPGKPVTFKLNIEKNVVPESIDSDAEVFPTPLANLTEALERLIQEPNGCFEQTSSTSYPLTMAQQYFMSHSDVDPKLVERSREKLNDGYKKLVGFWCPDRGYEWFGHDPGHEALTAFGIMHFTDMEQVLDVDRKMVETTRDWLMKQKDGKGGFTRKTRGMHTWIEDRDSSNAYIIWTLLESGQKPDSLKAELEALKPAAENSKNSYVIALAANSFELSGDKAEAKKLMQRLAALQRPDGSVDKVTTTIVGSGGEALEIEGTALTTLAWLREPEFAGNVEKSMKFLADSCKAGRYGSTQSTVLALRAIVTYDKQRAHPRAPGTLHFYADGRPIGDAVAFGENSKGALKLAADLSKKLSVGEHEIKIEMDGGNEMPYAVAVKYNTVTPPSSEACKLNLATKLAQSKVTEGASTEANIIVTNKTKEPLPTPVAIIGLPGGLEPRHDQLKELVKRQVVDAYEVRGRDVVLYWRSLPPNANLQISLSLIAAVPGTYTGPASRTYLYYTDEDKKWVDGMRVEIVPKG